MNNLVRVNFRDQELEAISDNGVVWVSTRRICQSLEIDHGGQLRKLKTKEWAGVEMKSTPDQRGRQQDQVFITLDSLPMWLATIEASRVSKRVRPMLVAYQLEAAGVLKDHFFKREPPKDYLSALKELVGEIEENHRLIAVNQELDAKVEELKPMAAFAKDIGGTVDGVLIGIFANMLDIDGIDLGQNQMFEFLRNEGFLIRANGARHNHPIGEYKKRGWFRLKPGVNPHTNKKTLTTLITNRGMWGVIKRMKVSDKYGGMHIDTSKVPEKKQ